MAGGGIGVTDEAYKAMMVALVCQSMREGMTARKACKLHGVDFSTIKLWCSNNPEWDKMYRDAREALFEHWEEDIVDIADTQEPGQVVTSKLLGTEITTKDMLEHRKLRIASRQWMLKAYKPKQFGDKVALGGADDLPPIQSKADVNLSPEDAYKQMLGIGGK